MDKPHKRDFLNEMATLESHFDRPYFFAIMSLFLSLSHGVSACECVQVRGCVCLCARVFGLSCSRRSNTLCDIEAKKSRIELFFPLNAI